MTMQRTIRRIVFAAVAALLPGAAQAFESPRALLEAIYQPYQAGRTHESLDPFYSDRIKGLFIDHANRASADLVEVSIDGDATPDRQFNPFLDADYPLLFDIQIGEPALLGEHALATVSFHNFDHPSLLSIAMVREADGWKVDDVTSTGEGENWMLSWLLLYDPWDVK